MNNEDFVRRIDEVLIEKGITRSKMLRALDLSESTIRGWKRGVLPGVEPVFNVASYLGVTVEYLLTGVKGEFQNVQPVTIVASPEPPKLKNDEQELLDHYRNIKAANRHLIMMMIRELDGENSTVTNNVTNSEIKP